MALDYSALNLEAVASKPTGEPLEILLTDIEENPGNVRKVFSKAKMDEIAASIKVDGVISPISVRSNPVKPGKWILNYGARRYRGSLSAGRKTIPAYVHENFNEYAQIIENIQREDLKPMELAVFIKGRLDAGVQKKVIAKNLGKDAAAVTQHLALIDLPDCIQQVYDSEKCISPKTLYDLRTLHEEYPKQVAAWCESIEEITRKTVAHLAVELRGKKSSAPGASVKDILVEKHAEDDCEFDHEQILENETSPSEGKEDLCTESIMRSVSGQSSDKNAKADASEEGGETKKARATDPDRISKPIVLVEYDGRSAALLLNRRPSTPGLLHIQFEDGGGEEEVEAGALIINRLIEGKL
ncbi:MAG: ParB/RepB/Spo0J family partition protein [Proteobacteria bacterium]|nr:MAG: ParB/RepB/Spo0J family partition protein [Pseudomonadota bacterium]